MDYVAGIDLGTSSVKVVLMDAAGHIAGSAGGSYSIQMPQLGWAEQDPENWWTATKDALKVVMSCSGIHGTQIKGIGFSGQMRGGHDGGGRDRMVHIRPGSGERRCPFGRYAGGAYS